MMNESRQVAVSVPIVLPWLLSPHELVALDIPEQLAFAASDPAGRSPLFLLCTSRKHPKKFLFSKGGIEEDEDAQSAAVREGWEEAGFRGIALQSLGQPIEDARPAKHAPETDTTPRAIYHFFLVLVTSLSKDWPERRERQRRWFSKAEMRDLTSWKVEVEKALVNLPEDIDTLEGLIRKRTTATKGQTFSGT